MYLFDWWQNWGTGDEKLTQLQIAQKWCRQDLNSCTLYSPNLMHWSGFSGQPMGYIIRELLWGISSHNYEGWQVQRSAGRVSELVIWEGRWCSSSLKVSRLKTQEDPKFQFKSEGMKKSMSQSERIKEKKFSLTQGRVSFFVLFRSSSGWVRPIYIREGTCLIQSININVNLIQKHPRRHIQGNVWPYIWEPLI